MTFDEQGYLTPAERLFSNIDAIEAVFVEPFSTSTTRRKIFNALVAYLTELKTALKAPIEVWVNGSFTTQKRDPNDIDFVIFVDKQVAIAHTDIINQFRQRRYPKNSLTDGYFVEVIPESHPDYSLYQLDRQDWDRTFVFGRNDRKGYLQLFL